MAIFERDVVLQGKTKEGDMTMDFPITRLANVEDSADVKESPSDDDYIPIVDSTDNAQMKKTTFKAFKMILEKIFAAINHNHDTVYAAKTHTHSYAATNHNHDTVYAAKTHSHDYAAANHNHDTAYAAKTHSHDYAAANHSHNYAGSSSAGGAASSAAKLNTNAGSATNPVYFANGIPVKCTYNLNKTVPADAVFTDTNTWRGIQNNLTSTSTSDSLSANQGKVLNDGKAPKASPTFTGTAKTTANTNYTTLQLRNIAFGTSAPASLENGAIYMVYE